MQATEFLKSELKASDILAWTTKICETLELQNLDGGSEKGWSGLRKYPTLETPRLSGITGTECSGKLFLGPKMAWCWPMGSGPIQGQASCVLESHFLRHFACTAEHCYTHFSVFSFHGRNPACCNSKTKTNQRSHGRILATSVQAEQWVNTLLPGTIFSASCRIRKIKEWTDLIGFFIVSP